MLPEITHTDVFRLETVRLWLRWPEPRDEAAIAEFAAREEVATMTASWPHPLPAGEVARRIGWVRDNNGTGRTLTLAITRKATPSTVIGLIGGSPDKDAPQVSHGVGYMLAPGHWGQGVISEALAAYRDVIFQLTPVGQLTAYVRTINPASRRVLEKTGFRHVERTAMDMPARGTAIPVDRFALDRPVRDGRKG